MSDSVNDWYDDTRANYRIALKRIDRMLDSGYDGTMRPFLESVRDQMGKRGRISKKQFRVVVDCYDLWESRSIGRRMRE